MKFDIHFLPARYGDCIWIEYGPADRLSRILIDGGTGGTKADIEKKLRALPEAQRHFELMVVTHIDRDHIEGILGLLEDHTLSFKVDEIWFNGWKHLSAEEEEELGALQGERLTAAILRHGIEWNRAFGGKAVVIPDGGLLPEIQLRGGMRITLLSPTVGNLAALKPGWARQVKAEGLIPGFGALPVVEVLEGEEQLGLGVDVNALNDEVFHEDTAGANGSSIAFLGSYEGKTVFFGGDSFPTVVLNSLSKLSASKVAVDLVKLSHHASAHNTSPELIEKFDSRRYLISTNGSLFHHPSAVTIAKVIKRGGSGIELYFNYKSKDNEVWAEPLLKRKHRYETIYAPDNESGILVSIL